MERIEAVVDDASDGERLDRFLAAARPDVSRSTVQRQIREGLVRVSDRVVRRAAQRVHRGEHVLWEHEVDAPLKATEIPLDILFEDDSLVVLDKPIGLVVHPGAGTEETTLVEGLLATRTLPRSDDPSRPGIVHRLDKATSGVIVVAKTPEALTGLQAQFADRSTSKSYLAVVAGTIEEEHGTIDAPVGRDPARPSRMAVDPRGRPSVTEFDVLARLEDRTLLHVKPRTGRTHQIRTHFLYIGHPVVGDEVYVLPESKDMSGEPRLLLHAWRLVLRHPKTGDVLRFEAPPPRDFPSYEYAEIPWREIPSSSGDSDD